jgi:hypothetical protein
LFRKRDYRIPNYASTTLIKSCFQARAGPRDFAEHIFEEIGGIETAEMTSTQLVWTYAEAMKRTKKFNFNKDYTFRHLLFKRGFCCSALALQHLVVLADEARFLWQVT